ncbi:hypothetical protein CTI14_41440, partial [Methylobacterium radiotolerans]
MVVRICAHNAAATGDSHVYTFTSAALVWGLSVWRCRPLVHVAHAGRRGDKGPNDDVIRHNQRIPDAHVVSAGVSLSAIRSLTESGELVRRERGIYTAPLS